MTSSRWFGWILLAIAAGLAPQLAAQLQTDVPPPVAGAKPVTVEHIKVHGTTLEGNLEGDAVDRDVFVFLPPNYAQEKSRRYPVVYALHGFSIGAEQWTHEVHVPQTIEGAFAQGVKEMIVVLPDSKTLHNGSMYSSSVTTGDFELFIARDLVSYIDAHYRTILDRLGRGLAGHSMGGYGATRIGMKHSDVFGSLYIMSPCCVSPRQGVNPDIAKSTCGLRESGFFCARHASLSGRLVTQSEESPALSRTRHERRSAAGGRSCEMGCQCATRFHGSVHRKSPPVPCDLHRCR
jgi:enterochelin esterase-like enzyme